MSLAMILEVCLVVYLLSIIGEFAMLRDGKHFMMELGALVAVVVLGLLVTNASTGRVAFGTSPVAAVGWMFIAVVLGIAARSLFYLERSQFSWLNFVKPISISPIVILPLVGSVQGYRDLNEMQVVSFALLAFQNGFFWQAVLERARPGVSQTQPVAKKKPLKEI